MIGHTEMHVYFLKVFFMSLESICVKCFSILLVQTVKVVCVRSCLIHCHEDCCGLVKGGFHGKIIHFHSENECLDGMELIYILYCDTNTQL